MLKARVASAVMLKEHTIRVRHRELYKNTVRDKVPYTRAISAYGLICKHTGALSVLTCALRAWSPTHRTMLSQHRYWTLRVPLATPKSDVRS